MEPVLDEESAGEIKDNHRRSVTAALLENQEKAIAEQNETMLFEAAPANNTSSVSNFDPVLISLVRRAMPNLIAYDVCGQPMNATNCLNLCYEGKISRWFNF